MFGAFATLLAFASAAVTLYWLLGGTSGLDTVGGAVEREARERSTAALAVLTLTFVAKCVGGALAWLIALGRAPRWMTRIALAAGALLGLYGGVLVVVGALALGGILNAEGADRYALRWHVYLWDMWFLVWGAALAAAALSARNRDRRPA